MKLIKIVDQDGKTVEDIHKNVQELLSKFKAETMDSLEQINSDVCKKANDETKRANPKIIFSEIQAFNCLYRADLTKVINVLKGYSHIHNKEQYKSDKATAFITSINLSNVSLGISQFQEDLSDAKICQNMLAKCITKWKFTPTGNASYNYESKITRAKAILTKRKTKRYNLIHKLLDGLCKYAENNQMSISLKQKAIELLETISTNIQYKDCNYLCSESNDKLIEASLKLAKALKDPAVKTIQEKLQKMVLIREKHILMGNCSQTGKLSGLHAFKYLQQEGEDQDSKYKVVNNSLEAALTLQGEINISDGESKKGTLTGTLKKYYCGTIH